MPVQVWIQTQKEHVQKIKLRLEEARQLSKVQKVKRGEQHGYMILPTNIYLEEEVKDESECFQLLSDLHLCGASQYSAAEIVYLPATIHGAISCEPKLGPIQEVISEWIETLPELYLWKAGTTRTDLLEASPKRWSVYEPMLLLPSGSFQDTIWKALFESLEESQVVSLWKGVLHAIWKKEGGNELTHLAINSGIPSKQECPIIYELESRVGISTQDKKAQENILRSPSGLLILHGDFGPSLSPSAILAPASQDLTAAFWVSTKQNGIIQTWAPRYTMFSRGNIKEKARLLSFDSPSLGTSMAVPQKRVNLQERAAATAVDLYAGIGYFAFSYAAAGYGNVVCWEINPWSVEGLRRGCGKNGWGCRVVIGSELERSMEEILCDTATVTVLEESNERAAGRIKVIRQLEKSTGKRIMGDVFHVNCGFLPSSETSWRGAWEILCKSRSAWLHLHENVGVDDVERRKREIQKTIGKWAMEDSSSSTVEVNHVELVKTFAPGVWHCVFDVHVQPATREGC